MTRAFCKILAEMHEAARDLRSTGAIDAAKMRKFDELCSEEDKLYPLDGFGYIQDLERAVCAAADGEDRDAWQAVFCETIARAYASQAPAITPNATTIAAMQERDLPKFSSLAEFMAALDEDEAE